jgi:hypothetical protein
MVWELPEIPRWTKWSAMEVEGKGAGPSALDRLKAEEKMFGEDWNFGGRKMASQRDATRWEAVPIENIVAGRSCR